jgi:phenylpyruvate tautomerase PptA (4-oxalocrotonate tautomerase family)
LSSYGSAPGSETDADVTTIEKGANSMPFIQCDLEQGLSDTQKRELVRRMAEITHKAIGSAMGHINVVLREHPSVNLVEAGEADRALISSRRTDPKRSAKVA